MIIKDFSLAELALALYLSYQLAFRLALKMSTRKENITQSSLLQSKPKTQKKLKLLNTSPMGVLTVSDLRGSSLSGNLNLSQISFLREARPSGMSRVTRSLPGLTIP